MKCVPGLRDQEPDPDGAGGRSAGLAGTDPRRFGAAQDRAGQKAAELIVMNAGPALYAADLATSLHEGIQLAHDALHTGLAREKMDELVAFTAVYREENAQ